MNRVTASDAVTALSRCDIFSTLPPEALSELARLMQSESFAPNEHVCDLGQPATKIFVVVSGALEVHLQGPPVTVSAVGPGQLLGEYGMYGLKVRTSTVVAKEPSMLLSLDYETFKGFLQSYPECSRELFEIAVSRMSEKNAVSPKPGCRPPRKCGCASPDARKPRRSSQ